MSVAGEDFESHFSGTASEKCYSSICDSLRLFTEGSVARAEKKVGEELANKKSEIMCRYLQRQYFTRKSSRILPTVAIVFWFIFIGPASAQSLFSNNVFAGYSFVSSTLYTGQHANLNGWTVSAEKKYLPFFGVVADFSGHYGSKDLPVINCAATSTGCLVQSSVSQYYFQAGVRGSYATAKLRPYAELLFGAVHTAESGPGVSNSNNTVASTLAAGLDARLNRLLGWRLEAGVVKSGAFTSQQNSVRASTGLVLRF
jgi:hypothetical protein